MGEDLPAKQTLEHLIDHDPPHGLLKHFATIRRAILVQRQRPGFAMQYFARLFLSNQLASCPHGFAQTAQPGEPTPQRAGSQGRRTVLRVRYAVLPRVVVKDGSSLMTHGIAIRSIPAQIVLGCGTHGVLHEAFVRPGEREDSR